MKIHVNLRVGLAAVGPVLGAAVLTCLAADVWAQSANRSADKAPGDPGSAMTMGDAVARALEHNPDLVAAGQNVVAARRAIAAAKAMRFPSVQLSANLQRWNEALVFDLGSSGVPLPPGTEIPPTVVRDQWTSMATLTASQPLTGLVAVHYLVAIERAGLGAAKADLNDAQLEVAAQAATAYLGALQARALAKVAVESTAQIQAQLKQARALEAAGTLGLVDVMRLEAALAAAEQQAVNGEVAVHNADEGLLLILGMPLTTEIEPADRFPDALDPPNVSEAQAVELALGSRPDLAGARWRAVQAEGAEDAARALLYPDISALAQVQHNEGMGTFQAEDPWFVGLQLSWTVWNWGKTWHDVKAAGARARAANLAATRQGDRVAFEVRSLVRAARASHRSLEVAGRGLAAAEEAFRIQTVRYEAGAVTTTDLVVAQTDVVRARANIAQARYEYLTNLVRLYRGLGALPKEVAAIEQR
jgi:outer membrane protein